MSEKPAVRSKKIEISNKKFARKRNDLNRVKLNVDGKVVAKNEQKSVQETDTEEVVDKISVKNVKSDQKVPEPKRPDPLEPKKLERSNSFIVRKLSQIYNKISGSKENLSKIDGDSDSNSKIQPRSPLTRSLTLNSIQLKKNYRKSFAETKLEKLSEEKNVTSPPLSPDKDTKTEPSFDVKEKSPTTAKQENQRRRNETFPYRPPKLERSNSILSIIKKKISFHEKKPGMNNNWNASLQNLQLIDNMVSYDNLSFVNYDLFNNYEKNLERALSISDLNAVCKSIETPTSPLSLPQSPRKPQDFEPNKSITTHPSLAPYPLGIQPLETVNPLVKRRIKKSKIVSDINYNLDRDKNVYRASIDSKTLKFLSSINLDSYRWSDVLNTHDALDWLSLENGQKKIGQM
jgi:hypothetical protein